MGMKWIHRTELGTHITDLGILVWRVGLSASMIYGHGARKLFGYGELAAGFRDPLGLGPGVTLMLAILAEFFCSILVALGLATRLALIPLISTMAVAGLIVHGADPYGRKELALVYLVSYLALWAIGPGRLSLDEKLKRRR